MYVKTTSRANKDGTLVRYLHLAHNQWDPAAGRSVPRVLYSFGREDALDQAAIKRLVASLSKLLDPADALAATVRCVIALRRGAVAMGAAASFVATSPACRDPYGGALEWKAESGELSFRTRSKNQAKRFGGTGDRVIFAAYPR